MRYSKEQARYCKDKEISGCSHTGVMFSFTSTHWNCWWKIWHKTWWPIQYKHVIQFHFSLQVLRTRLTIYNRGTGQANEAFAGLTRLPMICEYDIGFYYWEMQLTCRTRNLDIYVDPQAYMASQVFMDVGDRTNTGLPIIKRRWSCNRFTLMRKSLHLGNWFLYK